MTTHEQPRSDGIASRILRGVAWKAGSQLTLQVTRMVVALVLARLLAPHDWGLAAMVMVFAGFVVVFTDNALGTALIQRDDLVEEDRSTVFWMSAAVGLLLALAGIGLAGPIAGFYREPQVRALFIAISIGFFVSSLGTTQMALLVRQMEFRKLELRAIVATLVGAAAGIDGGGPGVRAVGDRQPAAGRGGDVDGAALDGLALAPFAHVLDREPAQARRLRRQRLRREPPVPGGA